MQVDEHAGVLSQTLASSPCIKTILAARIRSPLVNDVVFVGHSSIHLREFTQDGQLTNIITELDFSVQILAAKVVSAEAHILSLQDAILENGKDEIRYKIRGELCDDSQPPQIVVLSLASSELIFVYAKNLTNGAVQFVYARRNLVGGRIWPRKYGKHMAIDTESRALAVASVKGSFGIMSLKDVDEIKAEIDSWDPRVSANIQPFKEQRFIQVDGLILRMDFLRSTISEPHKVVLVLIVANQGTSRILLYRWDSWRPLTTVKPLRCSGQPLLAKDAFPHLLIPSCRFFSFAIVTGHDLVFYDDLNSKRMKRKESHIAIDDQCKDKQWVQWAKPIRHEEHKKKKEDIFLIREDGALRTIVVTHSMESRHSINFKPGHLGINVDTAVCALSAPPTRGGDILLACGDNTEGGVFHLAAREAPVLLQSIPNWSPICDVVHIARMPTSFPPCDHGSVLAATGMLEKHGALTELRYGIEAQIVSTMHHEEANSIDRLWALERHTAGKLLLLASHHEHTTLLCYTLETSELALVDANSYPQLSFDRPTLVASSISGDVVVQITANHIHTMTSTGHGQTHTFEDFPEGLLCADVFSMQGLFVVVGRNVDTIKLIGGRVIADATAQVEISIFPGSQKIDLVPTGISLTVIANCAVCMIGSQDGRLHLYSIDSNGEFIHCRTWALEEFDECPPEAKISSLSMLTLENSSHCLVICGLKTGMLFLFDLMLTSSESTAAVTIKHISSRSLGSTAVTIKTESKVFAEAERGALVACGPSLLRILSHRNEYGLDFSVNSLLITSRDDSSYLSPLIGAFDRIGRFESPSESNPSGLLACVAGDEILWVSIGLCAMVPRLIRPMPPTKHLMYCGPLRKCITSYQGKLALGIEGNNEQNFDRPALHLLEPNTLALHNSALTRTNFYFGEKGEVVRVVLNWAPTDGRAHYDMIIIGSDLGEDGRVAYMKVDRMSQTETKVSAKLIATYAKKHVSAICAYKESSLVVCAGREMKLLHLDLATRRWQHQSEFELPSRATYLEEKGSMIFVATSLHSFMLIREDAGKLKLVASDSWAGKARHIVPHGENSALINLLSDNGSRILNFSTRPVQGTKPTFEATFPQSMDKLMQLKLTSVSDKRSRFLGTTIDGTVYMFTTLTDAEMKLLKFLEHLCEPIRNQAGKSASVLAHAIALKYSSKLESAGIVPPSPGTTHARGDVLKALLEDGPYNIRFLLKYRVKTEESEVKEEDELEVLRDLSYPVLGTAENIVDGVVLWLRQLLNVPSF